MNLNSFTQAFLSLFRRPTRMSKPAGHILKTTANLDPSLLVDLLEAWAKEEPDPQRILCDIRVIALVHNKMLKSAQHEYLVVQTEDWEKKANFFILERTVHDGLVTAPGVGRATALESVKQLSSAIVPSSSDVASLEEGLPRFDRLTVSSVQAANVLLDSLDNNGSYEAVDAFLRPSFVFSPGFQGENIRFLKPKQPLSLYQLAIIAKAVHQRYPTYEVLKDQCYFHAGVIYSAVREHFGSSCPETLQEVVLASGLKYGRYYAVKIKAIESKDVTQVLDDYKKEYAKAMNDVSLSFSTFK
jgi:hypothetical protein